ncbi:MAG: AMP-binding protein, partial [bacterium]|nr:AMP-binding protein [bacterium]
DFSANIILSMNHLLEELSTSTAKTVYLDDQWEEIARCPGENPPARKSGPDSPAYALYTSGSTGRPKGAVIPHSALFNHMCWMREAFPLTSDDKVLQKTPFSFDASVWEFFVSIPAGGALVIAKPGGHKEPDYLAQSIQRHRITVLQVVPSLLSVLLNDPRFKNSVSLHYLFTGGEPLSYELKQTFYKHLGQTRLYNLYGLTEST